MAEIFSLPNVTDRIFSFIAERTCTLFFYFSRSAGYESHKRPELWPYIPEAEEEGLAPYIFTPCDQNPQEFDR